MEFESQLIGRNLKIRSTDLNYRKESFSSSGINKKQTNKENKTKQKIKQELDMFKYSRSVGLKFAFVGADYN